MSQTLTDDRALHVRPAQPADVSLLLPLMADFNRSEGIAWSAQTGAAPLRHLLSSPDLGRIGLCELDGEAVGYFVLCFSFDLEWAGRDAFLTELYVHPQHRGRGLGRLLLEHAQVLAQRCDVRALHLAVRPENASALRVYRAAGFEDSGRILFSKPLA